MKLRNQIHLYTAVLFISLIVLVNGAFYYLFSHMILDRELERVTDETRQALVGMNQPESTVPTEELLRAYAPIHGILQIIHSDGSRGMAVTPPELKELREQPVVYYSKEIQSIIKYNGIPHAFVSLPMIWRDGEVAELQVTESLKSTSSTLHFLRLVLIAVTALAIIPVLISSRLLSNLITQPITSMIATMRDIGRSGQFKRIVLPKKTNHELYLMGETFNHMMDLLEINYEKQGQFISNASHELKTPLTVIESYASLLKRRGQDQPELFEESVHAIHSEALRMKDLTEQLLLLAKHDELWQIELETLNVYELAEELIRSFQKAYHREVKLIHDTDTLQRPESKLPEDEGMERAKRREEVLVQANQQKLKQLFYIVLDNARKYSEEAIELRIRADLNHATVEISDRGIGIPKDDLGKIFDRFYRVDQARSRAKGGFGLGLSLAKQIADAMHADIRIESIEGHGTMVAIELPRVQSH